MSSPGKLPLNTDADASDWALRQSEGLSPEETQEWKSWLEADPARRARFAEARKALITLHEVRSRGLGGIARLQLKEREDHAHALRVCRRNKVAWAGFGFAVAAGLAVAFLPSFRQAPSPVAQAPTVTIRPDTRVLPDQSTVQLNAGSEIRVGFTSERRHVDLVAGEALFSVAKDPTRPFVVRVSNVEIRAVGTEFSVKAGRDGVELLVTEGMVAVESNPAVAPAAPTTAAGPTLVAAGNRLRLDYAPKPLVASQALVEVKPVSAQELSSSLAWREKRVEFTSTPLAEAVALFNRENPLQIVLANPSMASWVIGGVFWKDNPKAFVRLLELTLPLKSESETAGQLTLRPTS